MTGWLTLAQEVGGSPIEPEQLAAAKARHKQKAAETEPPNPLWQDIPTPELDPLSLSVELGARCLLGVSTDAPPPMLINRLDPRPS